MQPEVIGVDAVIRVLGKWSARDLAYVEQFGFEGTEDGGCVRIVALFQPRSEDHWPDPAKPMRRVVLRFTDIDQLRLSDFGGNWVQVMGFDIVPVADRGWESARFAVEDYEDQRISFYCRTAAVESVEEADTYI
ncbi:MAG: hypothetical protein R3B07_17720 [Polyangiaceae bacterium]